MNARVSILGLLVAGAIGAVVFVALDAPRGTRADEGEALAPAGAPRDGVRREEPVALVGADLEVEEPAEVAADAEPIVIEAGAGAERAHGERPVTASALAPAAVAPAPPTPVELPFEERYRDWPGHDLRQRANELYRELDALSVELFRKRYDAGRYEIYAFELGRDGRVLPASATVPPTPPELSSKVFEDEEAREYHLVVLPRAEYPDYYRELDEMRWVRDRFEELEGDR